MALYPQQTKEVVLIDYGEIEGIIRQVFGLNVSLIASLESRNDVCHDLGEFKIKPEFSEYEWEIEEAIEHFEELLYREEPVVKKNYGSFEMEEQDEINVYYWLQMMINQEILPEGYYIIGVSW